MLAPAAAASSQTAVGFAALRNVAKPAGGAVSCGGCFAGDNTSVVRLPHGQHEVQALGVTMPQALITRRGVQK